MKCPVVDAHAAIARGTFSDTAVAKRLKLHRGKQQADQDGDDRDDDEQFDESESAAR